MYLGPLQPTAWPFVKMTGLIYRHSVILLIFKKTHVHMVSYCCSLSCILEMQAHFTVFLWQMCIPLCNMDLVSEKDRTLFFSFFFFNVCFFGFYFVLFCCEGGQTLEEVSPRGCGLSICGDIQDLTGPLAQVSAQDLVRWDWTR